MAQNGALEGLQGVLKAPTLRTLSQMGGDDPARLSSILHSPMAPDLIGAEEAQKVRNLLAFARLLEAHKPPPLTLRGPQEMAEHYHPRLKDLPQEHIFAVLITLSGEVLGEVLVGIGTADTCLADPRDIFREAIKRGADGLVILHNHPNADDAIPSDPDIQTTERLFKCGELLGVKVLEHLVIARKGWAAIMEILAQRMATQERMVQP